MSENDITDGHSCSSSGSGGVNTSDNNCGGEKFKEA